MSSVHHVRPAAATQLIDDGAFFPRGLFTEIVPDEVSSRTASASDDSSECTVALESMNVAVSQPVIAVTARAIATIVALQADEPDCEGLALWVEVTGSKGQDFLYDLTFAPVDTAVEGDAVFSQGELRVVVPASSVDALMGATVDLPSGEDGGGLVLRNPNHPDPLAGVQLDLSGDLAERASQIITHMINPSLATHGGFATLVGVDEDKVYLTMGGGCHGCAASELTLRAGIARTMKEHLPEVREVIDVTDHATGDHPYFD